LHASGNLIIVHQLAAKFGVDNKTRIPLKKKKKTRQEDVDRGGAPSKFMNVPINLTQELRRLEIA
jgi:hypothetical protein